ncbi:hypothetical protein [Microbispora bryophytorum]|uniref:Uncharacterized protein n=1 Tax=Microbispora bryophytorum TaxID=1460882 RepID=A0A8H9H7G9_9ACTN|nr:hypothetical protein [Microbispora bryophytorum]MBD3137873.1 hypothetical protein [Microbispora bryophytorum]TQS05612.1 hypothetical protein FLX07_17475 [Microbispora bryophytorum]GGO21430.1 hypothetical protein GCM10011574_48800 [Microbispora bryophytorum]
MAALGDAGFLDVVSVWLDGQSTSGLSLLGHSMLFWGRAGKGLQFLAGCAVVLDLVDTAKLRAAIDRAEDRYERAKDRGRAAARVQHLAEVREALYDSFFYTVPSGVPGVKPITGIHENPPDHAPPGVDHARLVAFWTEVAAELPAAHRCRRNHREPCMEQRDHARGRIDDFLGRSLPERERVLIARAERAETWNDLLKTGSLVVAGAAMLALAVPDWDTMPDSRKVWLGVLAAAALLVAVARPVPLLSAAKWRTHRGVLRLLAFGVDRTRPFHLLRRLAFVLFVVGFLLDLLAS